MKKSNKKKYLIAGIVFTICIMIGASYAWWTSTATQQGINEIQSDCLNITLEDENEISLTKAYPLTDEEAKELEPYTFTIQNQCNTKVNYKVKLEQLTKDNSNVLKSEYVAIEVNGGQKQILSEYPTIESSYTEKEYESVEAKNIVNGTLEGNESKKYSLKLWMDEHVTLQDDATNKSFISKIIVEGGMNNLAEYTEPILHGADPVLESNKAVAMLTANEVETTDKLIPVIIGENGKVTKANTKEEWYNYEEKEWANAVILVDNSKEYKDGEEILESNIESYFVWMPKYSYKIFDLGNDYTTTPKEGELQDKTQSIKIDFNIENTRADVEGECKTPGTSKSNGECSVGDWMTHPAFTSFGDIKGIWVGKFETGYLGAQNTTDAEKDEMDKTKVIIKPNVYSWRNITVGNAFNTSYQYQRDLDSHLMKNTEWGAVAYLSHSIYGTCTNDKCMEVKINNSQSYVTGVAAKSAPTTGYDAYKDYGLVTPNEDSGISFVYPKSAEASTTFNNTGIYDMSGGAWEYMASVLTNLEDTTNATKNNIVVGASELDVQDISDLKYIDLYTTGTSDMEYNRRILGDATGELGPFALRTYDTKNRRISSWYADEAWFITREWPWFARGGQYWQGTGAGIFDFVRETGAIVDRFTFRIVLAP